MMMKHNFLNINLYREHSNANKARGDEEDEVWGGFD